MNNNSSLHEAVHFLLLRSGLEGVVILSKKPEEMISYYPKSVKITLAGDVALKDRNVNIKLPDNVETLHTDDLNEDLLKNKLLLCVDYLEHKDIKDLVKNTKIKKYFDYAGISVVVIKKPGLRRLKSLEKWLDMKNQLLSGTTDHLNINSTEKYISIVMGRLTDITKQKVPPVSVLAIIPLFNERDIIAATINHLIQQGVDVHVIDNWSSDGSFEIVKALSKTYEKRITFERFPEKDSGVYEWERILRHVVEISHLKSRYKWIMLNDADELRWSPWPRHTLMEGLSFVDSLGYNAVDFTVFNFIPIKDGFSEKKDPIRFFHYGEFPTDESYFVQIKSWKNQPNVDLTSSGGHHISFPLQKIYPLKFFLGHYPLRSEKQAKDKIFRYRRQRFNQSELKKGWHNQYDEVDSSTSFISNKDSLINYSAKNFKANYLIERLTGVGLRKK
jgi:glycosyltransferase involved in cell wall biosynthesis